MPPELADLQMDDWLWLESTVGAVPWDELLLTLPQFFPAVDGWNLLSDDAFPMLVAAIGRMLLVREFADSVLVYSISKPMEAEDDGTIR